MKKLIALLLCVCLLLSAAACTNAPAFGKSTDASNQDGEQRLRIVATLSPSRSTSGRMFSTRLSVLQRKKTSI